MTTQARAARQAAPAIIHDPDVADMLEYSSLCEPIAMTVFDNKSGARAKRTKLSLTDMARQAAQSFDGAKPDLPLWKLARFGDVVTEKGSLRSDANVQHVTGVEGDYDAGYMQPAVAARLVADAGIAALIYTSPSHGLPGKGQRWRILAPLATQAIPGARASHLARLNGVLGGVLAGESFRLSQSFYFGRPAGAAPVETFLIPGDTIDARSDLDAGASGPTRKAHGPGDAASVAAVDQSDVPQALAEARRILDDAVAKVAGADPGSRTDTLYRQAFRVSGLIACATIDREVAWAALHAAAEESGYQLDYGEAEASRHIASGFADGEAHPTPWSDPADAFTDLAGDDASDRFRADEEGLIAFFAHTHGDGLRFDHTRGRWLAFDGSTWRPEGTQLAHDFARQIAVRRAGANPAFAKLRTVRTSEAVERGARRDRAFATVAADWDADDWKLGTPGGTVDLRTGALADAVPGDLISKSTAVAPVAQDAFDPTRDCPCWLAFLGQALGHDAAAIEFLQRWGGYCLTGDTGEQKFLFVHGPGGSGKSTAINLLADLMGDYAVNIASSTLTQNRHDAHPEELARLDGPRMAWASETEKGRSWAENRLKAFTGGDRITARFMRQDSFEFTPRFKLTIVGNNRPALSSVDAAMKRRFIVLPFDHPPTRGDASLPARLRAEGPGILAWLIRGCLDWQREGLSVPDVARAATDDYLAEQDTFAQWLDACCVVAAGQSVPAAQAWQSWRAYALRHGEDPGSQTKGFPDLMKGKGFESIRDKAGLRGRGWTGLSVRPGSDLEDDPLLS